MHKYKEIKGDLISLALEGAFEVIVHGCNCFCSMKSGIAPQMADKFDCDRFMLENSLCKGDVNKLGQIQYKTMFIHNDTKIALDVQTLGFMKAEAKANAFPIEVVNAYTQYYNKSNNPAGEDAINIDYDAMKLCFRKINHIFKGKHIGMPKIGAGLAGGDWYHIENIIKQELKDCHVTVVLWERANKK